MLSWTFEEEAAASGARFVVGCDEAGRGCLAGPVVAAAVLFPGRTSATPWPEKLNDSKKLTRAVRRALFTEITTSPVMVWAVGSASVQEIDSINILQASFLAMHRAVEALAQRPDFALIDGHLVPPWPDLKSKAVVKGDGLSPSIAAASILAKESRDRMMEEAETAHPGYGFAQHKGYGTAVHLRALQAKGPCELHRRSFEPVAQLGLGF